MGLVATDDKVAHQEVVRRCRAYLATMGVADEAILSHAVDAIISGKDAGTIELPPVPAIERLMRRMEQWLSQIAGLPDTGKEPEATLRTWCVRQELTAHPHILFDVTGFPGTSRDAIFRICAPPVPTESGLEMPAQPLGAVPGVLHRAFWSRLFGRERSDKPR